MVGETKNEAAGVEEEAVQQGAATTGGGEADVQAVQAPDTTTNSIEHGSGAWLTSDDAHLKAVPNEAEADVMASLAILFGLTSGEDVRKKLTPPQLANVRPMLEEMERRRTSREKEAAELAAPPVYNLAAGETQPVETGGPAEEEEDPCRRNKSLQRKPTPRLRRRGLPSPRQHNKVKRCRDSRRCWTTR